MSSPIIYVALPPHLFSPSRQFNFVSFDDLIPFLPKFRQTFPNVDNFEFLETDIRTLNQLNALSLVQGITSLFIGDDGNPLYHKETDGRTGSCRRRFRLPVDHGLPNAAVGGGSRMGMPFLLSSATAPPGKRENIILVASENGTRSFFQLPSTAAVEWIH